MRESKLPLPSTIQVFVIVGMLIQRVVVKGVFLLEEFRIEVSNVASACKDN